MDRNEFQTIVHEIAGEEYFPTKKRYQDEKGPRKTLKTEWSTGGYSGGNCWDDTEATYYSSDNPEPDFTVFDQILEKVCPKISFIEYKALCRSIVYNSRSEAEYYGNSTNYSSKSISVDTLYSELKSKGLI
jgi:hypothetical protein